MQTIKLNCIGEASSEPDIMELSIDLVAESTNYGVAYDSLESQYSKLYNLFVTAGINAVMLKTSTIHVSTQKDYENKNVVFVAHQTLRYQDKVNMKVLARLLSDLRDVGMFNYNVSYHLSDTKVLEDKAIQEAIKDGYRRAYVIAEASGVRLGKIMSITDAESHNFEPRVYAMTERVAAFQAEDVKITRALVITWEIIPNNTMI